MSRLSDEMIDWVEADDTQGLLASMVESSVDGVVGLRLDGTVMVWNASAERIYGWTASEMLGSSIERIVPSHLRDELRFLINQIESGDVVRELITQRVRQDGAVIDVSLSVSPIRSKAGKIIGAVKTERDVTHRRLQDAITEGKRRLLETLTRTGSLKSGLEALLDSLDGLTTARAHAAVMSVDVERRVLRLTASRLPLDLETALSRGIVIAPRGHPSGQAAFSAQAVSARDLREDEDWPADLAVSEGLLSCCSTPIVSPSGEVLGTLDLYGEFTGDPPAESLEVVNALAQTAALVMDRFRTLEELRLRRATLAALNKINMTLAVELDSDRILHRVADEGVRLLGAQFGAFFYKPTGGEGLGFQTHVVAGELKDAFDEMPFPARTLLFGQTLTNKTTQRFDDVTRDPRFGKSAPHFGLPPQHPPVRSFLAVPVLTRAGELLGMLLFGHAKPSIFGRWHEEVLEGVASQAALALDNAAMYEAAQERAEAMAQADARKDEFLAALGHELRNPLSAIAAGLETLSDAVPPGDETTEVAGILRRQIRHMGRLIDDLLDMGRISRGEILLQRQVQDVRQPVQRAIDGTRQLAARRGVKLKFVDPGTPCFASIDGARIEQIVNNLVHNAIKFAPNTEVVVSMRSDDASVVISVSDEGRGIEEDRLRDIFDLFTQIKAQPSGGLGLGLALVKKLVSAHGGTVVAHSEGLGEGAAFQIELPSAPAPISSATDDADSSEAAPRRSAKQLDILLAEDQADAARATTMLLKRWGHRVTHAATGAEAIELAQREHPDVAILDIGLPDMEGWDVVVALRAMAWSQHLRIAVLSGLGQRADIARSDEVGVDRHFVKPVDPPALGAWLQQL